MRPMKEQQLRKEAERLIKTGKMPSLEKLCEAALETRRKYAVKIRRARSGAACGVADQRQDDTEARWDAFRERLGNRLREIAIDGYKVKGC